ncbi:MAG: thioredoxin family protein [Halobacteriales archaeon]|nr:thioredoxin family protein [Halobacteriales archaeon]
MTLETATPDPTWDADAHEDTVETFRSLRDEITIKVWGADWCPDCRSELPDFFAAMAAADVPDSAIDVYEVDRDKNGPHTDEYDVELIATIVIERDGEEIARFEEGADLPAADSLARKLRDAEVTA